MAPPLPTPPRPDGQAETYTRENPMDLFADFIEWRCEGCGDVIEIDGEFRTLCSCDAAE